MELNSAGERQAKWVFPFFSIWTGQALSLLGSQLVQFALIWWLTITTGSAPVLATATIVGILPQVLLGPFAGALVDRWNRRLTMILADLLIAGVTVVLAVLFALGVVQPWHVFLVLFLRSLAGTFHFPAMAASTSLMVPKEQLTRIQGAVAPEMQGRVFTLIGSFATAMSPIGLAIAGPLSDSIGVRTWLWIGGAMTGLMALVAYLMPAVCLIEEQRPEVEPALMADLELSPAGTGLLEID